MTRSCVQKIRLIGASLVCVERSHCCGQGAHRLSKAGAGCTGYRGDSQDRRSVACLSSDNGSGKKENVVWSVGPPGSPGPRLPRAAGSGPQDRLPGQNWLTLWVKGPEGLCWSREGTDRRSIQPHGQFCQAGPVVQPSSTPAIGSIPAPGAMTQ